MISVWKRRCKDFGLAQSLPERSIKRQIHSVPPAAGTAEDGQRQFAAFPGMGGKANWFIKKRFFISGSFGRRSSYLRKRSRQGTRRTSRTEWDRPNARTAQKRADVRIHGHSTECQASRSAARWSSHVLGYFQSIPFSNHIQYSRKHQLLQLLTASYLWLSWICSKSRSLRTIVPILSKRDISCFRKAQTKATKMCSATNGARLRSRQWIRRNLFKFLPNSQEWMLLRSKNKLRERTKWGRIKWQLIR